MLKNYLIVALRNIKKRKGFSFINIAASNGWKVYNRTVKVSVYFEAQPGDGAAWMEGIEFNNGTIEVDIKGTNVQGRSFVGIAFRGIDEETYDAIYFRPFNFKSSNPLRKGHSVQYISHPDFPWHICQLENHSGRGMKNSQHIKASYGYPTSDGWGWLYRFYARHIRPHALLRKLVRAYFNPNALEKVGGGVIFRLPGVRWFGKIIPTGGIAIRRLMHSRMKPYTLTGTSLQSARDFHYRTCVFEALHLPFFLALLALSVHRWLIGRPDLALENMLLNIFINFYPMLHHRYTRLRIERLVEKRARRNSNVGYAAVANPADSLRTE